MSKYVAQEQGVGHIHISPSGSGQELWLDSNRLDCFGFGWCRGGSRDNRKLRQTTRQQPRGQHKWHKPYCGGDSVSPGEG